MASSTDKRGLRIVSLAPSATSILVALGAGDALVGVTKWCKDVARLPLALRAPRLRSARAWQARLGDCWSLDPERVVKLRPTLVIGSVPYKQETVAKLLERPLAFLAMNPRTLADIESDIRLLGWIVGRERAAEKLVARMQRAFAEIEARARRVREARLKEKRSNTETAEGARRSRRRRHFGAGFRPETQDEDGKPRVYCEAWPHPRISSPPWVTELVEIAGGRMVTRAGARVSDADVARARPDVIVLAWAATGGRARAASALANPAWKNVPAVRHGHVYVVHDELLNTPGPPLVEGARELFRIIHCEAGRTRGRT